MGKDEIISSIVAGGVIPVIRASSSEEALALVDAIKAGGIATIEVTMTVPDAVGVIKELSTRAGLLVGAGSVLDAETARICVEAGARFIVSPATNYDLISFCNGSAIVMMAGALTPTEILNAWNAGADLVKVFPADSMGGPKYLRSLSAPMPQIKLVPTGGVSLLTAAEFIMAGAQAIGVGSDLVDINAIREGRHGSVTETARRYLEIVKEARDH